MQKKDKENAAKNQHSRAARHPILAQCAACPFPTSGRSLLNSAISSPPGYYRGLTIRRPDVEQTTRL